MRKVIITEAQYSKLESLLMETKFDDIIKNTVKVGDIIRITYKNTVNNFKVIDSYNGQIKMISLDAGSTKKNYVFFITFSSLQGDVLEIRQVHKTKEKDKLNDVKKWAKVDLKNVSNVEVIRNDKVIDFIDSPQQKIMDDILKIINVKKGQGLILHLNDNSTINFCVDGAGGYKYTLVLTDKSSYDILNNWDDFNFQLIYDGDEEEENFLNNNSKTIISTDGGKLISIKVNARSGDKSKDITIKNIESISITPQCDGDENTDDNDDEENTGVEGGNGDKQKIKDKLKLDAKKAYDEIINDPILKQAFYKQPSFWNLFVAELQGKKAVGTGIYPALKLVTSYKDKKIDEKLNSDFKTNKNVSFKPLEDINIKYLGKNAMSKSLQLERDKEYINAVKVRDYELGVDSKVLTSIGDTKYKILVNKNEGNNVFICDIVVTDINKKEIKKEDVRIEFLPKKSEGYKPKSK